MSNDPIALSTPPNDYYNCFACNYGGWAQAHHHLDLINALGAWDITTGLNCIKIGIVDFDFRHHNDLDNKVIITPRTANIDNPNTNLSHGVEVAGMAGAETNNNLGISSLGYNISLQYYSAYSGYAGILDAIYDECKVVNCSWGSTCSSTYQSPTTDIQDILSLAQLNNVTVVAAAGNGIHNPTGIYNTENPVQGCQESNLYVYPASYDGVISVTSVGSQYNVGDTHNANWKDCHRIFTNSTDPRYNQMHQHNDKVDICAPGQGVETTTRNNDYGNDGGTSLAAPLVSAAAALLYSINPFFTPAQIEGYLKNNAVNIYGVHDNYLWAGKLGAGRLDVAASLQAALSNAYTGNYCNSCPSETTYLTYTGQPLSGYFYNQNVYAGSNNSNVVSTSSSSSTNFVATNSIVLTPKFNSVATANASFSARIEPCTMQTPEVTNKVSNTATSVNNLDTLNKKERLKIYPNPANNIITLTYSLLNQGQISIDILNNVGVVVKRIHKNTAKTAFDKTEIDILSLPAGLYYVIVKTATSTYTNKFVKL